MIQAIGKVTTQDNNIDLIIDFSIMILSFHFFLFKYSLNNQIPNTQPIAIWVEETGKPNLDAMITVVAADSATQNALIWSNFVISFQTVFISLAQNIANHIDNHNAHNNIIQKGTQAALANSHELCWTVSYIAASGQIAFATSFEPCAKLNNATAKIRGMLNSLLTNFFLSLKNEWLWDLYIIVNIIYDITQIIKPIKTAEVGFTIDDNSSFVLRRGFNHFNIKYIENIIIIIPT